MDAEANPDLYGLRRSGRAPTRKSYVAEDDDDADEDEDEDSDTKHSLSLIHISEPTRPY